MMGRASLIDLQSRRAWLNPVRRLAIMLVFFVCALSLAGGSIAHAREPVRCVDVQEAAQMGHVSGDSDQVPGDSEKSFAHHHGGCHGHQIGEPAKADAATTTSLAGLRVMSALNEMISPALPDPGLRPPIA